ncbi:MAG: LysE family translocator [Rhizobiaceae bacterium]
MTFDYLLALAGFSFVSSITPGPNNIMLLASGVNFGFRRTIPHMLGISGGFAFLLACIGFGLGQLLTHAPMLYNALRIGGAIYLLYLAWKIATSGPPEAGNEDSTPMTFLQASAFQWVNPKAWVMAVTSMAIYTSHLDYVTSVLTVVLVFTVVNLPCIALWCGMGVGLKAFLSEPFRLKLFNWTMAALLVMSLWPMLK